MPSMRKRHGLARLPTRALAVRPDRRHDPLTRSRTQAIVQEKPYLGPERLAWDIRNGEHVTVSPATIKRMKRQPQAALLPPRPPPPAWCFSARHHPDRLWHRDLLEKMALTDRDQTAYQLMLTIPEAMSSVMCSSILISVPSSACSLPPCASST